MAVVIVYDSFFGNTSKIAQAMATELQARGPVRLVPVGDAADLDLTRNVELLIVGSPTRGFLPTPAITKFCDGLDAQLAPHLQVAAFDTRILLDTVHPAPLRWVVDAGGYAAGVIARTLTHKGFTLRGKPMGFYVSGTEGPLNEGEIDRACRWAATMARPASAAA